MDTSFWDDEEDKVQIIYQDDQPPMQPPQEHAAASGISYAVPKVKCRVPKHVGYQVLLM